MGAVSRSRAVRHALPRRRRRTGPLELRGLVRWLVVPAVAGEDVRRRVVGAVVARPAAAWLLVRAATGPLGSLAHV